MEKRKNKADFVICKGTNHLEKRAASGWRMEILYHGPTDFLDEFTVHHGVLDGRSSPHPPHRHDHEELHFPLADGIELLVDGSGAQMAETVALAQGDALFTDSSEPHTFRNAGDDPTSYLHIRWKRNCPAKSGKPGVCFIARGMTGDSAEPAAAGGLAMERIIYSGPTRFLPKFILKCVALPPGAQVPLHRHDHEVVFALVAGGAEILGRRIDAPAFALMSCQVPHCLLNPGPAQAIFYALEFHRPT